MSRPSSSRATSYRPVLTNSPSWRHDKALASPPPIEVFYPGPDVESQSLLPTPMRDSFEPASAPLLGAPRPSFHRHSSSVTTISSSASLDTRYPTRPSSIIPANADPSIWLLEKDFGSKDIDDYLHDPDPRRDRSEDSSGSIWTGRGIANLGFVLILIIILVGLFAGYPVVSYIIDNVSPSNLGAHNIGGINRTGQVPEMSNRFALVDPDTPDSALYYTSHKDGSKWQLMFSDEFNVDGRSFYPGDDPYWEAVDYRYWATGDMEWYDPSAVGTSGGSLRITLSEEPIHGFNYKSGHVTSWNKLCLTGGYIEVNVSLPGTPTLPGFWPAVWTMGNLGRAGYGATTDGLWPYSYDSCDWGTLKNQTFNDQPSDALTSGPGGGSLSWLPGQRLSACSCPNDPNHPGPSRSGGGLVGRGAPEIDILEAGSFGGTGTVSQSMQVAPFNSGYHWAQGSDDVSIYNASGINTVLNSYQGGVYQEAVSAVSNADQNAYEVNGGYATYGLEYVPGDGDDGAYITWFSDGQPVWTLWPSAIGSDSAVNISNRLVSPEPMYILMNLGYSHGFGEVSPDLTFPAQMSIDYIRVYQDPSKRQMSCNPDSHPTEAYINKYIDMYTNPNYTSFARDGATGTYPGTKPKNQLVDTC